MTTVFLFGAGASFGSEPPGVKTPPLGFGPNGLFAEMRKVPGSIAASLDPALQARFVSDFEDGMNDLWERDRDRGRTLLMQMNEYLVGFLPTPESHYRRLAKALGARGEPFVLGTLNYEMMLEAAFEQAGFRTGYGFAPNPPADGARVIKIHGSVNFLCGAPGDVWAGNTFSGETEIDFAGPSYAVPHAAAVAAARRGHQTAMAMYATGKEVRFSPQTIWEQQEGWAKASRAASRFVVIGARYNPGDGHVWGPVLGRDVPRFYVGKDPHKGFTHIADTFAGAMPELDRLIAS